MSVEAITKALAIQGVSSSEKLLLIVLANYADEHMKCWPSHSRLAKNTCMSERTILRLFTALEARKLVSRRARFKNKVRTSDIVSLHFDGDTMSPRGGDTMSPYGDTVSEKVGTPCRGGGDTMSPRTVNEPKLEPSGRERAIAPVESASPVSPEDRAAIAAGLKDLAAQLGGNRQIPTPRRFKGRAA